MRWLIPLTLAAFFLAGSAVADPQTDALCRPIQGEWESVARANDIAAMDREIAKIPPFCATLKAQARQRVADVARQRGAVQAAAAEAARQAAARDQAAQAETARQEAAAQAAQARTAAAAAEQAAAAAAEAARLQAADDDAGFSNAKAADTFAAYQSYLSRFSAGRHVGAAQAAIGSLYNHSKGGVIYDGGEATRWFRLGADNGDPDAEAEIGNDYRMGMHLPLDYAQANHWLGLAAAQGQSSAQFDLALDYQYGNGVPVDYEEAARLYRLAGTDPALGDSPARALADLYINNHIAGTPDAASLSWIEEYASAGSNEAKTWLAQHPR